MKKRIIFRSWFYFRTGWSTYFAFILGAVNTLTLTYYLAIEEVPILKEVFPTFLSYVIVAILIIIPTLTSVGYVHFKKSGSYKAEADIGVEANPHFYRLIQTTEITLPLYIQILDILTKLSTNEKLSDEEIEKISKTKSDIQDYMTKKTLK
ncbi:MAG: hypothetical protein COA77_03430 [Thaumarchaeota archaeon]|nr:MAG: hypothetical protein COA77_03430 [Nitrososphaerota archaeon]